MLPSSCGEGVDCDVHRVRIVIGERGALWRHRIVGVLIAIMVMMVVVTSVAMRVMVMGRLGVDVRAKGMSGRLSAVVTMAAACGLSHKQARRQE